ncbi:unnamed protein product [Citrullus colocynthis]|uniref:Mei2-like C-terminal RNA recognition motif domain-containing protein n=1 Tax=Citrullus colocynthis TaxID=252529 RepID=A0ABP0YY35_9ROSI
MTTSLNPNADPFLYTTPFLSPPKPQFSPIPIYKTPPTLILAPPLHGYGAPNYVGHPMLGLLSHDVVPQVASSWPCSDGLCGGGGERKYCKIKKCVPRLRFRVGDETTLQFQSPLQLLPSETQTTTLMIKNIPNQFRRNHLMNILDEHCKWKNAICEKKDSRLRSEYDFVYLPMDFRKYWFHGKISNLGYAFVNFTNPTAASEFCKAFHRRQWDVVLNKKVCEVKRAKLQGLKALMDAFRNKIFWCHANNYLPVMLEPSSDGYRSYRAIPVGKRIARPPPCSIKKCG